MLSRRQFLAGSLATTVALSRGVAAAQAKPAVSFGFSLYGMKNMTVEAGLAACARIGYDAVELAVMPGWPAEPRLLAKEDRRRIGERLAALNLSLPALMENTPLAGDEKTHRQHLERLRRAAELGHALAPKQPPLIETVLGGAPGQWDKVRELFAARLADWAKLAAANQVVICIKPHRFGAVNLPAHALWLLQRVNSPWIKTAYDFSHYEHRGLTVAETMQTLLPHTRFIHVKDARVDKDRVQFLLPGDGQVDYVAYCKQLATTGYRGCVCVEVSGMVQNQKGYDPVAAARRCYQNLAPALAQAGLGRKK